MSSSTSAGTWTRMPSLPRAISSLAIRGRAHMNTSLAMSGPRHPTHLAIPPIPPPHSRPASRAHAPRTCGSRVRPSAFLNGEGTETAPADGGPGPPPGSLRKSRPAGRYSRASSVKS